MISQWEALLTSASQKLLIDSAIRRLVASSHGYAVSFRSFRIDSVATPDACSAPSSRSVRVLPAIARMGWTFLDRIETFPQADTQATGFPPVFFAPLSPADRSKRLSI